MEVVERTYYSGEANADFELMMGPMAPGTMSLGLAHKRRMSHEQLMAILDPNRTSNPNPRAEQDIVCTAYPDDEWAQQNIVAFYNWLTDAEAKRKAA